MVDSRAVSRTTQVLRAVSRMTRGFRAVSRTAVVLPVGTGTTDSVLSVVTETTRLLLLVMSRMARVLRAMSRTAVALQVVVSTVLGRRVSAGRMVALANGTIGLGLLVIAETTRLP